MAEPYSDEELAEERGPLCGEDEGPGLWEDRLQATIRRLRTERDAAIADARMLADAAVKFDACGPQLLNVVLQAAHDHLVDKFDTATLEVVAERRRTPPEDAVPHG